MKTILFGLFMFLVIPSFAVTEAQFSFDTFVLRIKHKDIWGVGDDDAERLYKSMNVPPSTGGFKGKVISSPDKKMNIMCAPQGQNDEEYLCSIVLRSANEIHLDPINKKVRVSYLGPDEANLLFGNFYPTKANLFEYTNVESTFAIQASPSEFKFWYQGQSF